MTIPNKIIYAGKDYPFDHNVNYEKTTNDNEVVAGRVLSFGTAVTQLSLKLANKPAVAVGKMQHHRPGQDSNDKYDSTYARDGKAIDHAAWGPFLFKGCLNQGNSVAQGDPLQGEDGTGKLDKMSTGHLVAVAMETSNASSADDDDFLAMFMGLSMERWIEETLTVTTHVATMTYIPTDVEYVEGLQGTAVGGKAIGTTVTAPEGGVLLARTSKTLTFSTTDAVTQCKVRYKY